MARVRRELVTAVLLCAAGALVQLVAVSRPWYTVRTVTVTRHYAGSHVAGAVRPLALVALAGAAALLATRRRARALVGLLLVAVAGGSAAAAVAASFPHVADPIQEHPVWRFVVVAGALPVFAAGALGTVRGRAWSEMSARYDPPAARTPLRDPDVSLWDALDRGDDPTGEVTDR